MSDVQNIINRATKYLGVKESPANSNNVVFNTEYYGKPVSGSNYSWCAVFVWYVFNEAGFGHLFCDGKKVAYCPTVESWAKQNGIYFKTGQPGDLCLMDFGKGRASHIGIVESVNPDGSYTTIEGNTSSKGSQDNGGAVCRKTRYAKNIRGFARPRYGDTVAKATTSTTPKPTTTSTTSVLPAKSKDSSIAGTYKVTASSLNIRRGPDTKYDKIGAIKNGETVQCYGYYTNEWYLIKYNNIQGFVSSDYLSKV